jgi:hypothetical protein
MGDKKTQYDPDTNRAYEIIGISKKAGNRRWV